MGRLPQWFQLWLNSCARNQLTDWLLFTDDRTNYNYPDNVKVHYLSFDELRQLIQRQFDFPIKLSNSYKLCDFKPCFGEVFQEYLEGYEYWGHCDTDQIWGNLDKWLVEVDSETHLRISHWGHCCLYRNLPEVNALYRTQLKELFSYRDVFSNEGHIPFDEECGMNIISREKGMKEFVLPFFDIQPAIQSYGFVSTYASEPFFDKSVNGILIKLERDGLFVYGLGEKENVFRREIAYVHIQKRKMKVQIDVRNADEYLIVPNRFVPNRELDVKTIKHLTPSVALSILKRQKLLWKSRFVFMQHHSLSELLFKNI